MEEKVVFENQCEPYTEKTCWTQNEEDCKPAMYKNCTGAVFIHNWFAIFFILSPTSRLSIGFTLIFEDHSLFHVTIRFCIRTIPIDIGLTYLRIILRWWSRSWIFLRTRRRSSRNIGTIHSPYRQNSIHIRRNGIHLEHNK